MVTSGPAAFTYAEVGATRSTSMLPGAMHTLRLRRRVGGRADFEAAAAFVLSFGMQRGVGLQVQPSGVVAREGLEAQVRLGVGPLRLVAPVRVVYVVEERDRRGFAYGTLPGHPECGEEAFLVVRDADSTWVEVRAFSRPGRWFTRLAGPVGRLAQRHAASRYLEAVAVAVRAQEGLPPVAVLRRAGRES